MILYQIDAHIVHHTSNRECVSVDVPRTLPTFYLNKVQFGIMNLEHAEQIARSIIMPVNLEYESVTVNVRVSVFDTN